MKQAIIGVLIALFLSVQSSVTAARRVPYRENSVTGVVAAVFPSYILVRSVETTKTVNRRVVISPEPRTVISQFILRPQTKIDGKLVVGASVTVTYRIVRRGGRIRRNMVSLITVMDRRPPVQSSPASLPVPAQ